MSMSVIRNQLTCKQPTSPCNAILLFSKELQNLGEEGKWTVWGWFPRKSESFPSGRVSATPTRKDALTAIHSPRLSGSIQSYHGQPALDHLNPSAPPSNLRQEAVLTRLCSVRSLALYLLGCSFLYCRAPSDYVTSFLLADKDKESSD